MLTRQCNVILGYETFESAMAGVWVCLGLIVLILTLLPGYVAGRRKHVSTAAIWTASLLSALLAGGVGYIANTGNEMACFASVIPAAIWIAALAWALTGPDNSKGPQAGVLRPMPSAGQPAPAPLPQLCCIHCGQMFAPPSGVFVQIFCPVCGKVAFSAPTPERKPIKEPESAPIGELRVTTPTVQPSSAHSFGSGPEAPPPKVGERQAATVCGKCGAKLKLPTDGHLKPGSKAKCPKCGALVMV
jgi:hypothetical protein